MSEILSSISTYIKEVEELVYQLPQTATNSTLNNKIEKAVRQCKEINQMSERLLKINVLDNLVILKHSSLQTVYEPDLKGLIDVIAKAIFKLDYKQAFEIIISDYFKQNKTLLDSFMFLLSDLVSTVDFPLIGGINKLIKGVDFDFAIEKTDELEDLLTRHLRESKIFDLTRLDLEIRKNSERLGLKRERVHETKPKVQNEYVKRVEKKEIGGVQSKVNPRLYER